MFSAFETGSSDYRRIHKQLIKIRGNAWEHQCANNSQHKAEEWSWIHDKDPNDVNNYDPKCASCHRRYDCKRAKLNKLPDNRKIAGIELPKGWSITNGVISAE